MQLHLFDDKILSEHKFCSSRALATEMSLEKRILYSLTSSLFYKNKGFVCLYSLLYRIAKDKT